MQETPFTISRALNATEGSVSAGYVRRKHAHACLPNSLPFRKSM